MKSIILLLSLLIPLTTFSCINEYEEFRYTESDGSSRLLDYPESSYTHVFRIGFDKKMLLEEKMVLEEDLKHHDYKKSSDYALVLLKLGEYQEGLKILQKLIKKHPNEYNIAANLGTAYELTGRNDSAFKYISRAVEINPYSHEGSEWIHIKILQAKLAMQVDPDYLKKHSILDLSVVPGEEYSQSRLQEFKKIKEDLVWQLKERIAFVPPQDVVVADLLYDLANLIAVTGYLESSLPVYEKAMEYGPADSGKVSERINEIHFTIYFATAKAHAKWVIPSLVLLVFLGWLFIRRRRKRRKKREMELVA